MQYLTQNQNSVLIENPTLDVLGEATECVEGIFENSGVPMAAVVKMNIALDEIYSNIVKFSGASLVKITCGSEAGNTAYMVFEDNGIPYNPLEIKEPDVTLSAEERIGGGLGFYIVKKTMTELKYEYAGSNNILTLKLKYKEEIK